MSRTIAKLLSIVSFVLLVQTISVHAQISTNLYVPDARLYECMDKASVDQLCAGKSELILYYNYYLDSSYYTIKLDNEKPVTGTDIHTVTVNANSTTKTFFQEKKYSREKFNPLKYNFTRKLDACTIYIWKEAGIAIIFQPERYFQDRFHNFIKNSNLNR